MKWVILISAIFVIGLLLNQYDSNKPPQTTNLDATSITPSSSEHQTAFNNTDFIKDLLYALDNYHQGSIGIDIDESSDDIAFDLMVKLKNDNNKLQTGNRYLEQYKNDKNEVIKLATEGTLLGSQKVIDANNKLYEFLKYEDPSSPDVSGTRDAIAQYISEQKEGYSSMALFAPQVGYLIFSPAESENPTGKIPYLISDTDRNSLIDQIDRSFTDYLYKTEPNGDKNSIIFVVETIRNYLSADTYEKALQN